MFKNTKLKLEESRRLLEDLATAKDSISFRTTFNAFLGAAQAVIGALKKEGRGLDRKEFNNWYKGKEAEMNDDALLTFVKEARKEDFHEGKHRLLISTKIEPFVATCFGIAPSSNAKAIIQNDGPFWLIDEGTSRERRIPAQLDANVRFTFQINNPPKEHLGQPVENLTPLQLCRLAYNYYAELAHEAVQHFSGGVKKQRTTDG